MPHLHLETTADVPENADIPDILDALCQETARHPEVTPERVRAHHTLRSVWVMGPGAKPSFIHLTVAVQSGRSLEWKQSLGQGLMDVMKSHFAATVAAAEADLTLEIREMDGAAYQRHP